MEEGSSPIVGQIAESSSQREAQVVQGGLEVAFSDVSVVRDGSTLLQSVSGSAVPGELMAIMGPSGAGKTTLLNTLAGRVHPSSGEITVNDTLLTKRLRREICYVLQHDMFFPSLTLRQTLTFTAMIRLPGSMSKVEKISRMHTVVETLDLQGCMDTPMGGMMMPGLSGGEKKRASIACELLRDPKVILLDEPTTGLDSSTASSLIATLADFARKSNKTIVASIHQPSSQLFFLFNKLLLLCSGQVAYFGGTTDMVDYFTNIGIVMEQFYNPADFIMEKLKESEDIQELVLEAADSAFSKRKLSRPQLQMVSSDKPQENGRTTLLGGIMGRLRKGKKAPSGYSENDDLDPGSVRMSLLDLDIEDEVSEGKWPTGFLTQYTQLTLRSFRESRKRILDVTKLVENFLICAVLCLLYFQLPRTEETLRDRMGAVFFIAAHWGFIPLFDAVTAFPLERPVINKERAAGWYRLSAYYLAKMTSEIVLILFQPALFVIIAYWVIGLNGIAAFFATLGTVFINSIAGQSFGMFIGITCLEINQAMTVSITLQMAIMLLGGLFTRTMPPWLDWAKYLSFLYYSFHSLLFLEFSDAPPVQCAAQRNSSAFFLCKETNGTQEMISSSVVLDYYDVRWQYWQYILPLIFFAFLFRTLGYIVLRFIRKPS